MRFEGSSCPHLAEALWPWFGRSDLASGGWAFECLECRGFVSKLSYSNRWCMRAWRLVEGEAWEIGPKAVRLKLDQSISSSIALPAFLDPKMEVG